MNELIYTCHHCKKPTNSISKLTIDELRISLCWPCRNKYAREQELLIRQPECTDPKCCIKDSIEHKYACNECLKIWLKKQKSLTYTT